MFCFLSRQYFKDRNFRVTNERKIFAKTFAFFLEQISEKKLSRIQNKVCFCAKKTFTNGQNPRKTFICLITSQVFTVIKKRYKIYKFRLRKFNSLSLPIQSRCRRHFIKPYFYITLQILQLCYHKLLTDGYHQIAQHYY